MSEFDKSALLSKLASRVPGFRAVLESHVSDYDEVLPHVLLGDLTRLLADDVRRDGVNGRALAAALPILEAAMGGGDQEVQELIAVSFIENLAPDESTSKAIATQLGPRLTQQYVLRWPDAKH